MAVGRCQNPPAGRLRYANGVTGVLPMFGIADAIVSERDWNHDASIAMNKTGKMPEMSEE